MRARAKESDIKLTDSDLARIRAIAGPTLYFSTKLKSKLAAEYKQILLDKAGAYVESGETSLDVYTDQEEPVSARDALAAMAKFQALGAGHNPQLFSLLGQVPRDASQNTESFLYWALQVDLLGGPMGFIKRRAAQPRMLETLKMGLEGLRQCAEAMLTEQR